MYCKLVTIIMACVFFLTFSPVLLVAQEGGERKGEVVRIKNEIEKHRAAIRELRSQLEGIIGEGAGGGYGGGYGYEGKSGFEGEGMLPPPASPVAKERLEDLREKRQERIEDIKEKRQERREDIKERRGEYRENLKERKQDRREGLKERKGEYRENLKERKQDRREGIKKEGVKRQPAAGTRQPTKGGADRSSRGKKKN